MHSTRPALSSSPSLVAFVASSLALTASHALRADDLGDEDEASVPSQSEEAPAVGASDGLTADEIYSRVLDNRFQTSAQELLLNSGDRAGREQKIRMQMLWMQYTEGPDREKGIQSRTVVRYMEPSEMRGTGYLIINKADLPSDQFVYLNSMRRIRRINLRGESVVGTDLSLEDIVPREMDDATYTRVPDESVDDTPCFVVEATPNPEPRTPESLLHPETARIEEAPAAVGCDQSGAPVRRGLS